MNYGFKMTQGKNVVVANTDGGLASLMLIIDRAAKDPAFDVAKLDHLLQVKERWDAAEAKKAYVTAVAQFKTESVVVKKDKKNAQYNSMYTSIGNLVNVLSAALSKYGLSARWDLDQSNGIKVTCILTHVQGHSESTSMSGPADNSGAKNPLQQIKSTVTYLRIATLEAITGTASKEGALDDDGGDKSGLMDEAVRLDFEAAIDAAADTDGLERVWKEAVASCKKNAPKDIESYNSLKAKVTAKGKALRAAAKGAK